MYVIVCKRMILQNNVQLIRNHSNSIQSVLIRPVLYLITQLCFNRVKRGHKYFTALLFVNKGET